MNRFALGCCPGSGEVFRNGEDGAEPLRSGVIGGVAWGGDDDRSTCITCPECREETLLAVLDDDTLLLLS